MKKLIFYLMIFNAFTFYAQNPELIFRSGFEPNTEIVHYNYHLDKLIGEDTSYLPPNNWFSDFSNHPYINFEYINYGHDNQDQSIRSAEIKQDPDLNYPDNKVMQFWISEPYLTGGGVKGRVQVQLDGNSVSKFCYSVRLFLPTDLSPLKDIGFTVDWFTLMEFWNNPNWNGSDYPFRIKLGLYKNSNTDVLKFRTIAQKHVVTPHNSGFAQVWSETNHDYDVPLGKWMTLQVYYEEGDNANGRFKVELTPDGENSFTLIDKTGFTHHPSDPNPNGVESIQPMKLYTSEGLINYVNTNNGFVNLYWDDFVLCNEQGLDLHISDDFDDLGEEPYSGLNIGVSPDIWVRNQSDNIPIHQSPIYNEESPNFIYVRINNKSCNTSNENDSLKVYWSLTNTPLTWPAYWNGSLFLSGLSLGNEISTISIPKIQPGTQTILEIPWYPPNPKDYDEINRKSHAFSLLARIESNVDEMTFIEGSDIIQNVRNNNNISIRYLQVFSNYELNGSGINVYPNPGKNNINIEFDNNSCENIITIKIIEISNGDVKEYFLNSQENKYKLDVSDFNKGVYEVLFYCNKIIIDSKKIIIN